MGVYLWGRGELSMSYKSAVIYVMSGTGNSYRSSVWLKDFSEEKKASAQVIPVEKANPEEEILEGSHNLAGIVMPTHAFTAPWHMLKFVYRLPRRRSTHAFCIATRTGLKFGRVFTPGISGSGTFIIAILLALKGYDVRGVMSLDMPSNWMSLHSGLHPKNVEAIISRAKPRVSRFTDRIFSNEKYWLTLNNLYEVIWGLLLFPISVLYLLIGRFFLAKLFFANNDCNGCGICANNCAVKAIKMTGLNNPRPFWKYNCESCMRCMAFCPHEAIEAGHSWAVMLYFITSVPISSYLLIWFSESLPFINQLDNPWLKGIFDILYIYPSLFISYYLFNMLMRIRAINYIFTYTTFTHLYRRYHEPDTKIKDISRPIPPPSES